MNYLPNRSFQALRSSFAADNLQLAVSISGYPKVLETGYDLPAISQNTDFINIMTYDYYGFWDGATAHHSPLRPVAGASTNVPGYSTVSFATVSHSSAQHIIVVYLSKFLG